jgi:hypothetical protein
MINKINKERRRSMNATPTWPSNKNQCTNLIEFGIGVVWKLIAEKFKKFKTHCIKNYLELWLMIRKYFQQEMCMNILKICKAIYFVSWSKWPVDSIMSVDHICTEICNKNKHILITFFLKKDINAIMEL